VEFGDKFVGNLVMSGCGCIIEVADDFVDFIGGGYIVLGSWVVVSLHQVGWEGWSDFYFWWEEGIPEDIAFSMEVI
jgi:hypothetical protein